MENIDLLETRPPGPAPATPDSSGRPGTTEERERIHIKSLHAQWADKSVVRSPPTPHRVRGSTPSPPPVRINHKNKKRKKKRVKSPPRTLEPILFPTPPSRSTLDTSNSLSRLLLSTAGSNNSRDYLSTPFSKQSIVVGHENPKVLQSFLANFLENDLGSFKKFINLAQHGIDSQTEITDATLQEIADLHPQVEGLNLANCREITDVGLWALARNCCLLVDINFENCTKITHVGLRSLSLRCSSLRRLNLKGCIHTNDLGLRVVAAGCAGVRFLSLEGCTLVSDGGISEIAKCCKGLERLILKNCIKLCEFGDRPLIEIGKNCPRLRELDLTNCDKVRDGGIRAIARGCAELEILRASGCVQISGAAVRALGRGCPRLSSLGLGDCKQLTNKDIWCISENLRSLKSLSLRGVSKLKPHGIRGLCEWSTGLETLNLSGCHLLNNDALTMMGNALPHLRNLDISGLPNISGKGLRNLCEGCTRLLHLEAGDCRKVNQSFLRELCRSLPFVKCAPDRVALIPRPGAQQLIKETEQIRIHHAAAVVIQRMVRGVRARGGARKIRQYALRRFVVPKMQALARGYLVRKHFREEKELQERIRAALFLQRTYRGHKGRERARRMRRIRALQNNQSVAAVRIQAVFRGWQGRIRVRNIRRLLALQALQNSEQRGREEMMALRIQRAYRARKGRLCYLAMKELKQRKEEQEFAEKMAAMKIQAAYRGREAYKKRMRLQAEKIRRELEERSASLLQRLYRGMVGRRIASAARRTRRWKLEQSSALVLQKAWRGFRGRHIAAIMLSFAELQNREVTAATKICGWWRSLQASHLFEFLKLAQKQRKKEIEAAIVIQKTFRGHKGREEREVVIEFNKIKHKIAPLLKAEKENAEQLEKVEKKLNKTMKFVSELESKIHDLNVELTEVTKHKSKWYDSANVTGTLQRYKTTFLAQALRSQIEDCRAKLGAVQLKTIDHLQTEVRVYEKELREIRKELAPQHTNLSFFVRQNRASRLRKQVRERAKAAKTIQLAYLHHRVRLAMALGGLNWQEAFDENTGARYFFNVVTQENTYDTPWAFAVLQKNSEREDKNLLSELHRVIDGARRACAWVEYHDEATGYPFYYSSQTGEYRWEMPPEYAEQLAQQSKDTSALKSQNVEELTARSARLRDVSSGWVEYRDENDNIYYYNAISQVTQWEKPDLFEAEWIAGQDTEALTSRSVKTRQVETWQEYQDEAGHLYYVSDETGEARWDKPKDFDQKWLDDNQSALTARSVRTRDLSESWQELVDPETGHSYYYCAETNETKWSLSPQDILDTKVEEEEDEEEIVQLTETEEVGAVDDSEDGWVQYQDESGAIYYYHHSTGETKWEEEYEADVEAKATAPSEWTTSQSIPLGNVDPTSPWQEMFDAESNCAYWWNSVTGETAWTLDEALEGSVLPAAKESFELEEELDDEELETRRNRDPMNFTTATRLMEVHFNNISYDPELMDKVQLIVQVESENPVLLQNGDAEHVELCQWLAEYVLTGQLMSAAAVADQVYERIM